MANWMDAILDRIREAAEAQETASAPDVQDSAPTAPEYSQPENLYAQAAQGYGQPENTPYAPTPYALYGMGDTPLDAAQGRELLYSAQKAREERRAREAARIEEEARQARERQEQARKAQEERLAQASARIEEQARMARELQEQARQAGEERAENARQIAERRRALEQEPQGVQNALGDVYGAAEQRDDSLRGTPYADVLRRRDYTQHAGAGESRLGLGADTDRRYDYINDINGYRARADEQAVMTDDAQRLGKYGLMTDDEIGVYNYLYSTRGREAADRYLDELDPELNKQYYSGVKNSTMDEIGDSALDQGLYSGLTVLQQPVRSARSALAVAEDAYRAAAGQGIDPYSELRTTSRLTQDIRGEIAGDMSGAGSFAYQTAMSALDSAMNAIVAQGIGEGLGIGGDMASKADVERLQKAVNAIGSLTMSSEVASMAVAEAKEKNYSDAGALSLGLVRGGIEYLSEKIGGEWIINKAKGDPTSFWYALKSAMVPEGVEEVMSDVGNELINWFIDPVFGTQESFVANTFRQYKNNGADDLAAAGMTAVAVIQQEILSFAGGAFAAIGSGATNYRSNTMAFNDLAARLNTDTRGVVDLMREVGAEDVFQLRELAELHDAQSVEQLRERVADTNAVNEAVDAEMRKAGEKENAPAEAEAVESAAQTEAEGAQIKNGNAQIENGNAQNEVGSAQAAEEGGQTAEKPSPAETEDSENDSTSSYIDTNPETHTPEQMQRITEYINSVDKGLKNFIQRVRELKNPKYRNTVRYSISETAEKTAAEIRRLTGVDVAGFENIITGGAIDHIERRHGKAGKADHSMANINDLSRVQYILDNFDGAYLLTNKDGTPSVSDVWKNSDNTPAQRVVLYKDVDGTYYAVQAVPDSNAKVLAIESAFIGTEKNKGPNGTVLNMANDAPQATSEAPQRADETFVSDNSIPSSTEESNPQNEGGNSQPQETVENGTGERGSEQAEAAADLSRNQKAAENGTAQRTAAEIRREIRQAENEYSEHADAGDEDYDFKAQLEKIKALRAEAEEAEAREQTQESAPAQEDAEKAEAVEEAAPTQKNGGELETRENAEEAKKDLLEVGEGQVKNDTGDYTMKLRLKRNGMYLASVEINGRRDAASTFHSAQEAAEWAEGYVKDQTRAREDAALDRHKSKKERAPTITEALFGQVDPKKEADRRLRNSAADAETQTLRGRIRRANDEIQALNRLEKTTGLTEQQKAHREDLRKTLEIMNDELDRRKARNAEERKAQAERRKAERVEVTGNKPTQSTADARREIMNLFHTPEGVRNEVGAAVEQRLKEMLETGRVTEESRQALFDTLVDAGVVPKQADPTFRQIRDDLSGRRIFVSEKERADFGDNWKSVYQKAWGARIFLTSDPTDTKLDAVNSELAEVYGERMFPTDAALSDMLDNMLDKAERGKTTQQSLADAVSDEARYTGESEDQIYLEMSGRLNEQLRTFAKKAGLEVMLKNKAASDAATERKRWEDRQERKAQERRESKIRERVQHGLQRLEKLRGKAAPEVRTQIDEVLKDIDTQARSLTPYGIENLQALQKVYEEKAQQEGFVDDDNPGNFIRNPYVEEQLKRLSQKHLNEMDIADVIALGNAVSGLVNTVQTANRMIGEEFDASVKETAEAAAKEIRESRGAKPGFLQKWFAEEQLSPRRFLNMLGGWKNGTMAKLAKSLEDGQTRMLDFQRRAIQSFDPFMSKKENKEWLKTASGKNAKWSKYSVINVMDLEGKSGYSGQEIEITPMMKIALYLHSLNDDNLRHIQTGGIVVPNKALYQKGQIQEAYAKGQKVKMQPEAVRAIASTLTAQEKTFAGYLQKFFNEQSKAAINEVSMQLDGFERASVADYFPIETDSSFLKSDVAGEARAQTVEGIGSIANERVHAGNPIRLCDASDVLMRQIDKVSRYYGYAIPIRNFNAVNDYVFHEEGNAYDTSMKKIMIEKWNSGAQQYITKMLADLQSGGSAKTDMLSRGLAWLRGNMAGATLSVNPSVAVSQAASYPGAAQVVGWDGLAAGLRGKVDEKLIEKYTPLLWYRSQGYSTQELGDAKSAANQNMAQKALTNKWLNWIQGMDRATVKRLWAAAEYRVKQDTGMKPGNKAQIDAGTDPYYKAVAEVFNRAVYDTQPNYTNMERAQILRSESDLTKFLTMYKTVPLQYYGMMTEAAGRLQAAMAGGTEQEKAAARKYAADTFGGLLAANTVYAAIKALFKGFRRKDDAYRDEEGELTAESVTKQLGKDLAEVYAGSVIGGAEAYSAAQYLFKGGRYNAPELNIMSYGEDFIKGLRSVYAALDDEDPRKTAKAIKDAALTISQGMGLPVKNVETYFMAGVRWLRPDVALGYDNAFGGLNKSDLNGMDPETVGMATNIIMRDRTGETLDRSTTDELARLYGAGHKEAVPTAIPESFEYGGNTVKITDRAAYRETWGGVVGDNLEELLSSDEYKSADDKGKKAMISKLYQYATVQARMGADPEYSPEGNSTYGWTLKADEAQRAGIDLPAAIGALTTFANMTTDRDAIGTVTATKKSKVLSYIDGLDMDDEQKDLLYEMAGYTSGLEMAPWHSGIDAGVAGGTGPKADAATKKSIVDQYTEALTGSAAYQAADDNGRKAMLQRLQEYATVQGMKKTDPGYSPSGNGYGWTVWADQAVKAGIELPDAIAHMTAMSGMKADYDKYGKAITGSKKDKVCAYIDALNLSPEQKDALYLYVYKENSLRYTPWHGYKGKSRRGGSGGRRGRGGGKRTSTRTSSVSVPAAATRSSGGIDVSKLFGGSTKAGNYDADASRKLLEIIDKYYGGDPWAAALDGGRAAKGKTKVDFKL